MHVEHSSAYAFHEMYVEYVGEINQLLSLLSGGIVYVTTNVSLAIESKNKTGLD